MEKYEITGMNCAACSARVEKAVLKVDGVDSCSVNLLTNSMTVEGTSDSKKIIEAVKMAGYGASKKGDKNSIDKPEADFNKSETSTLKARLISSLVFLVLLMYISMGYTMFGFPTPSFFENNPVATGLLELILSAIVIVINQKFFISGAKALINGAPNMDTLVSLGSGASFIYSVLLLFLMIDKNIPDAHKLLHGLYFESAAMILALIDVGKMLESRSKGKTADALNSLMKLSPKLARVIREGEEKQIPVEEVVVGDVFVVKTGEGVPVDGVVKEGECAIDESILTGESIPVDKKENDRVSAGTKNMSGYIKCVATKVGEDTTLSQIIKMVSDASATKAPVAKIADRVSGIFVPVVIAIAIISTIVWLILGKEIGFSLARGISVLVISCPCALGLATPVAIMVGNGVGARNGILFKNASALEMTGKINTVVLDKTGTITTGKPRVTDIIPLNECDEKALLEYACSVEIKSEHPLAQAIVKKGEENKVSVLETGEFKTLSGSGVEAKINNDIIRGGNESFILDMAIISEDEKKVINDLAGSGKTPVLFSKNDKLIGIIAVADTIKEDSPEAIEELKNMGIQVIMLTGDNELTAKAVGDVAGVSRVIAGVLPKEKENYIQGLKVNGKVCMVGDGINDAPALMRADIGIAIGAGTEVAIDAADIVLMKNTLMDISKSIRLSRKTLKNIKENLFWAFIYNIIGIPIAAGVFISSIGWELNPMLGAAAMSLSSFFVVTNALRLNYVDIGNGKRDKRIKVKKEKKTMEKTIKIEGMMCCHCEARVKKLLEEFSQVDEAIVSHESGTAILKLNNKIDDEILKNAIEEQGYNVV